MRKGKEIDLLLAIRAKARAAVLASYPTDTASGSPANFPDGADGVPVVDLTVSIEPVQEGSGDPSPENVRPISGWMGMKLTKSKALPDMTAWNVMGINEDEPVDQTIQNLMTVQAKNLLTTSPFDPPQYLFAVTAEACAYYGWPTTGESAGMPAGTYNITCNRAAYGGGTAEDGTFQFTTTKIVPIGGGVRHSYIGTYQQNSGDYAKAKVLAGTFSTYGADTLTTIETGLVTTEGNDGTNLGTTTARDPTYKVGDYINFSQRLRYGSGRWSTSYIRQRLNSADAKVQWVPKTIWSRNDSTAQEGFLHTLDPDLVAGLCKVRKRYALSIADGYGYEDIEDTVTLATLLDMGGGNNNSISEGPVDASGNVTRTGAYSFWTDHNTNADRIKYSGSTVSSWWLGSTSTSGADWAGLVNSSGAFGNYNAGYSRGLVPSLFIKLDDFLEIDWTTEVGTVYGGTLDVTTGVLTVTKGQIASYAGETLPGEWVSDRDVYAAGTSPSTGAQVVYDLSEPITYQLTPKQMKTLLGENNLWADTGDVTVEYRADLEKYIEKKTGAGTLSLGAAPSVIRPGTGMEMQPLGLDDAGVDYIDELPDADEYLGDLGDEYDEPEEEEEEEPEEETDDEQGN